MFESKYERFSDKNNTPSMKEIDMFIGAESVRKLSLIEKQLENSYSLTKQLKFPFGNNYGWGYKYSHKSKHLCYIFFEKNAITVTLQLGDKIISEIEKTLPTLTKKANVLWENRYPCGENGGWIHYEVVTEDEVSDIIAFVHAKVKPQTKK